MNIIELQMLKNVKEKKLINKCYEEIEKYLKCENPQSEYTKITKIMNILASLRLSHFRNMIKENELLIKIYTMIVDRLDRNDFETVQRCTLLINVLTYKDEHPCF